MSTKDDFDKLINNSQWVEAVDSLIDGIKVNCKPNNMREHKFMSQLRQLLNRIEIWNEVGPACTESEHEMYKDDRRTVNKIMEACSDVNYVIPKFQLKEFNRMWKRYAM